jgi:hypothetical protein
MTFRPSSILLRMAYAVALVLVALPIIAQIGYARALFSQMSSNPNVINPITATSLVLLCAVVSCVVLFRLWSVISGRCKLDVLSISGPIYWLRIAALVLLFFGVFVFIATLLGRRLTGIAAVVLIAGQFRLLVPVGLILFEFSRLLEHETTVRNEFESE